MCEIVDVTNSAKTYKNPGLNKLINVRLTLSIGGAIKENNRINEVSNSRISQAEYDFFLSSLEKPSARDAFGDAPVKLTENQVGKGYSGGFWAKGGGGRGGVQEGTET